MGRFGNQLVFEDFSPLLAVKATSVGESRKYVQRTRFPHCRTIFLETMLFLMLRCSTRSEQLKGKSKDQHLLNGTKHASHAWVQNHGIKTFLYLHQPAAMLGLSPRQKVALTYIRQLTVEMHRVLHSKVSSVDRITGYDPRSTLLVT